MSAVLLSSVVRVTPKKRTFCIIESAFSSTGRTLRKENFFSERRTQIGNIRNQWVRFLKTEPVLFGMSSLIQAVQYIVCPIMTRQSSSLPVSFSESRCRTERLVHSELVCDPDFNVTRRPILRSGIGFYGIRHRRQASSPPRYHLRVDNLRARGDGGFSFFRSDLLHWNHNDKTDRGDGSLLRGKEKKRSFCSMRGGIVAPKGPYCSKFF